jgi:hypothetical protein
VGQAIGGSLALAAGVALSPVPIIAVVVMLTSGSPWRARSCSASGPAGGSSSGSPATWVSRVKVVLGLLLLLVAARQFRAIAYLATSSPVAGDAGGEHAEDDPFCRP